MQLSWETFTIHKRYALKISRGVTGQNTNVWVKVSADNITGMGESSVFSIVSESEKNTEVIIAELNRIAPLLERFHPLDRRSIEKILQDQSISSNTRAGIDVALQDWMGKRVGLPLWQMWGLDRKTIVPISVTIGISSPRAAVERVEKWLEVAPFRLFKLKLGSPDGIEADKEMFLAVRNFIPHLPLTVDANGGWNLEESIEMCQWLAHRGVTYVEQPLGVGREKDLEVLYQRSPLPLFADESCFCGEDIPHLAPYVHGINIKLMKAGGLGEVMRMIHIAQACNLKIMFGCYSDSSLANTAMSHLSPYADYLDLDSHLNLIDDPFQGVSLEEGRLLPGDLPGLGIKLKNDEDGISHL
ncbi:MAG: L-Ala-D/L-Glu epimerase [Chroococcopsis gigantea SAG 12.99]|jgi:L-alanine-DL-glutamate epimerase-like enolase superfamily enzyme|nr:dipeptide epimerase [Chlorogloea purpurea SAG 13.99]MDV3001770.1 L-Ala-D/L-Glu epimerase [Chroococcopsis gigantea SAG 12.99]